MFAGSHALTVDEKGRLAIPARFRQELSETYGPQVFITRANEPSLEIYPASVFHELVDRIDRLDDSRRDRLKQIFVGHAFETELDKQGRVLLPQLLRKSARIDGSAVIVGQNKRMDLWAEDLWQQKFGDVAAGENLADAFALLKR